MTHRTPKRGEQSARKIQQSEFGPKQLVKENIKRLGFELSQAGVKPLELKIDSIRDMKEPKTLQQLRGLLGSAHR